METADKHVDKDGHSVVNLERTPFGDSWDGRASGMDIRVSEQRISGFEHQNQRSLSGHISANDSPKVRPSFWAIDPKTLDIW
jgi:hypothetical protein